MQRRVYDALNVLSAMNIIHKHKNNIIYNENNTFIDDEVHPNTAPMKGPASVLSKQSQNSPAKMEARRRMKLEEKRNFNKELAALKNRKESLLAQQRSLDLDIAEREKFCYELLK